MHAPAMTMPDGQSERLRRLYERRRRLGLCTRCGDGMPEAASLCSACREHRQAWKAGARLSPAERKAKRYKRWLLGLELLHATLGPGPHPSHVIAAFTGVTAQRVGQVEARAFKKLRAHSQTLKEAAGFA